MSLPSCRIVFGLSARLFEVRGVNLFQVLGLRSGCELIKPSFETRSVELRVKGESIG